MGKSDTSNSYKSSDSNDDVELGDTSQQLDDTRTDIVQRKKKETTALLSSSIREDAKKRKGNKTKQKSNGLTRFELFALFLCIILLIFIVFSLVLYIQNFYKASIIYLFILLAFVISWCHTIIPRLRLLSLWIHLLYNLLLTRIRLPHYRTESNCKDHRREVRIYLWLNK